LDWKQNKYCLFFALPIDNYLSNSITVGDMGKTLFLPFPFPITFYFMAINRYIFAFEWKQASDSLIPVIYKQKQLTTFPLAVFLDPCQGVKKFINVFFIWGLSS